MYMVMFQMFQKFIIDGIYCFSFILNFILKSIHIMFHNSNKLYILEIDICQLQLISFFTELFR